MKKFRYAICIVLIILLYLSVQANAIEEDKTLTDLLAESQNAGGLVPKLDPDRVPDSVPSLEGTPILVVLRLAEFDDFTQYSLEELYDKCAYIEYTVLNDTITVLSNQGRKADQDYQSYFKIKPTFIADILNSSTSGTFRGAEHNIQNVICLRGYDAVFVYYITDGGVFVRVYADCVESAPCVAEFSLEQLQKVFGLYMEFLYSNRCNDLSRPNKSRPCDIPHFFPHYISDPGSLIKKYCYIDTKHLDEETASLWIKSVVWISTAVVVTVVIWYLRDRKKRMLEATIAAIQATSTHEDPNPGG